MSAAQQATLKMRRSAYPGFLLCSVILAFKNSSIRHDEPRSILAVLGMVMTHTLARTYARSPLWHG